MSNQRRRLWAGVALVALCPAAPALAQAAAGGPATFEAQSDVITVFGQGVVRQQSSLSGADIQLEAPGTSPLKAIERLPGVHFSSADPFGTYEWSARITLRGFNTNQIGYTLDGVPLGDMTYGNHNGLHVSRAIISDNIDRVDVAQGSGSLGTASANNLGGTIEFISRRPGDETGGDVAATYGDEETMRLFGRFDSGALLGDAGPRFALSGAMHRAEKWKGMGEQNHDQINAAFTQAVGAGELSGFYNWSERRENDYQDLSLDMIGRLGYGWDNISGDWATAMRVSEIGARRGDTGVCDPTDNNPPCPDPNAPLVYPSPFQTVDDAYFNASGLRDDDLASLRFSYPVAESFEVSVMGYGHRNEGQGTWWTPYVLTAPGAPNGAGELIAANDAAPITVRTTEYDIERYGLTGSATYTLGMNEIEAGFWLEANDFTQARRFYGLQRSQFGGGRDSLEFMVNPMATQWEYDFETETRMFYIQDTFTVTDALTVFAGAKSLTVENTADTVTGADKSGTIEAEDNFLPQAGFTFELNADHELFGSYSENIRAFASSGTSGPFSTTAAGFAAIQATLQPESSRTYELGWRFRFGDLQGSVAAYDVLFEDRLLGVSLGAGIIGAPSAIQNVGSVKSQGVELAALYQLSDDWSVFGSFSHNEATYEDDVVDGNGNIVPTGGKTLVDTPEDLFRAELSYDNGSLFATLAGAYTGERFFTYLNDQSVDEYSVFELTAGYRFDGMAMPALEGLEVQLNITNLFTEEYVSTLGSNGFGNSGDNMTLLAAPPRQTFVTLRKRF